MGLKHILSQFVNSNIFCRLRWFSVSRLEYNEAYVKNSRCLIGGKSIFQKKNPLQDLLSSLNAVISTNERHWIIEQVM